MLEREAVSTSATMTFLPFQEEPGSAQQQNGVIEHLSQCLGKCILLWKTVWPVELQLTEISPGTQIQWTIFQLNHLQSMLQFSAYNSTSERTNYIKYIYSPCRINSERPVSPPSPSPLLEEWVEGSQSGRAIISGSLPQRLLPGALPAHRTSSSGVANGSYEGLACHRLSTALTGLPLVQSLQLCNRRISDRTATATI